MGSATDTDTHGKIVLPKLIGCIELAAVSIPSTIASTTIIEGVSGSGILPLPLSILSWSRAIGSDPYLDSYPWVVIHSRGQVRDAGFAEYAAYDDGRIALSRNGKRRIDPAVVDSDFAASRGTGTRFAIRPLSAEATIATGSTPATAVQVCLMPILTAVGTSLVNFAGTTSTDLTLGAARVGVGLTTLTGPVDTEGQHWVGTICRPPAL